MGGWWVVRSVACRRLAQHSFPHKPLQAANLVGVKSRHARQAESHPRRQRRCL